MQSSFRAENSEPASRVAGSETRVPLPDNGYRMSPTAGAVVRSDIVDVYIFRRRRGNTPGIEFLQLLRTAEPMGGTWHPVMGHIEAGETAIDCAVRELQEEVGLVRSDPSLLRMFALEQVHPYFIPQINTIVLSPRFAAEVTPDWNPTLNDEHSAFQWTVESEVYRHFMWPGQMAACKEIIDLLALPSSQSQARLSLIAGKGLPAPPGGLTA
ncbi:MAG: NUDIX domain-containing protein [Pyrinomonadaceae bacterium]|nr:NUDIX domain-containing protein [Phycisphaerales bacterium]